jgi:uncharacterized Zn ribbon protein
MEVIDVNNPFYYGRLTDENDPKALEHLANLIKVYDALENGLLHVRFTSGDRAGSIAKLAHDSRYNTSDKPRIKRRYHSYRRDAVEYDFENDRFYTVCTWDGRRNSVQATFPNPEAELLIGYDGPTVWAKFDAKAAKEAVLKNPNQRDIDGNVLAVGDKVMYINARYGSGMVLTRGVVEEFKASVDSKSTSITTIIRNSKTGETSSMSYPQNMVSKL